jgi:hypothetical protein
MNGIELIYKSQKINELGYAPCNNLDSAIMDILVDIKVADKHPEYRDAVYSLNKKWFKIAEKNFS